MTDRIKGLVICLDADYRDDDVEEIIQAIKMIKGVSNISKNICDIDDQINRMKIRMEYLAKFEEILREK